MKKLIRALLLASAFTSINGVAGTGDEPLGNIEDTQIIINRGAGNNGELGYLLALPCSSCESRRFSFDSSTQFYLEGLPVSERDLGGKVDWRGRITFSVKQPTLAVEVFLQ
ncbi:hypothetical protein D9M70_364950 [compost metagenome]